MGYQNTNAFDADGCIPQRNPNYVGNCLIERLPDASTFKLPKFYRAIEYYPCYHRRVGAANPELRRQLAEDAARFFVPLKRHSQAAELIDTLIREGYRDRNPVDPCYWATQKDRVNELRKDLKKLVKGRKIEDRRDLGRASGLCRALFGLSGVGKTVFIKELLKLYKQLIEQASYCGYRLNIRQVVYVYIEVEKNGSTTALCRSFFRELDKVLGTNYVKTYGDLSIPLMLEQMAILAGVHALGLLVIDELQELSRMKSGGGPGLLGFFLSLTNRMNTPVLLIGTEESIPLVEARLQDARRTAGIPEWAPLTWPEFKIFWKALSQYEYTRKPINDKEDEKVAKALYEESHGLTDLAVKIYVATQRMVIGRSLNENVEGITPEAVTPEAIRIAATTYHANVLTVLNGRRLDGTAPENSQVRSTSARNRPTAAGINPPAKDDDKQKGPGDVVESLLNRIVMDCKNSRACYDALKQAGVIKVATEFL